MIIECIDSYWKDSNLYPRKKPWKVSQELNLKIISSCAEYTRAKIASCKGQQCENGSKNFIAIGRLVELDSECAITENKTSVIKEIYVKKMFLAAVVREFSWTVS